MYSKTVIAVKRIQTGHLECRYAACSSSQCCCAGGCYEAHKTGSHCWYGRGELFPPKILELLFIFLCARLCTCVSLVGEMWGCVLRIKSGCGVESGSISQER